MWWIVATDTQWYRLADCFFSAHLLLPLGQRDNDSSFDVSPVRENACQTLSGREHQFTVVSLRLDELPRRDLID